MEYRHLLGLLGLILLGVLGLSTVWEFVLGDMILSRGPTPEPLWRRWEYVITCTSFSGIAIAASALLLVRVIAERQKIDQALHQSEARLKAILDNAPVAIGPKDAARRYVMVNRRFEKWNRVTREQIVGKTSHELYPKETAEVIKEHDEAVLKTGEATEGETEILHEDGVHTHISVKFPIPDAEGGIAGVGLVATDITERKRAEEALRESEELLRTFAANIPGTTYRRTLHRDGRTTYPYMSPGIRDMLGLDPDMVMSRAETLTEKLHPDDRAAREREIVRSARTLTPYDIEYRCFTASGDIVWLHAIARPHRSEGGDITWDGITLDVTERRRAEDALRESEAALAKAQRLAKIGNWRWSIERDELISCSEEFARIHGVSMDEVHELLKEQRARVIHPEDRERVVAKFKRVHEEGVDFEIEYRIVRPDGEVRHVLEIGEAVPDASGRAVEQVGTVQDITGRKRAEEALSEKSALLDGLVANSPISIAIKDPDGRYILVNPQFEKSHGISREKILGQTSHDLFPAEFADNYRADDRRILETRVPSIMESESLHPDGTVHTSLISKFPVLDANGELIAVALIGTDITERKHMEASLARTKDEAVQANLAKSRFLAAASHDLRQPLHALQLSFDALSEQIDGDDSQSILNNIELSLGTFDRMFNDLLDVTRLEMGALRAKRVDFPIAVLLAWLKAKFTEQARQKGLELCVVPCSAVVRSDAVFLERVLQNLVSNAVRYTESGRVLVGCRRRSNNLRVEVWDTGIGIPEDEIDNVFDQFYRGKSGKDADESGLGLGLAIAKQATELLVGHRLTVTSSPGRGSVFLLEVPYGEAERLPRESPSLFREPPGSFVGNRVLIIEDDRSVAEVMCSIVKKWGCEVSVAQSADEALSKLAELRGPPDLALVDYFLKGKETGIEALDRIEAMLGKRVPAVIISGTSVTEVASEAEKRGYPFLQKPVRAARLRALCNHLLLGRKEVAG